MVAVIDILIRCLRGIKQHLYRRIQTRSMESMERAIVPWSHGAMVPWCHSAMVPWCHGAMVPWCHGATMAQQVVQKPPSLMWRCSVLNGFGFVSFGFKYSIANFYLSGFFMAFEGFVSMKYYVAKYKNKVMSIKDCLIQLIP